MINIKLKINTIKLFLKYLQKTIQNYYTCYKKYYKIGD